GDYQIVLGHEGVDQSLLTEETGSFTYRFDIDTAGFYYVKINYFAYEGKAAAIERSIKINGETPFIPLGNVVFHRYYGKKEEIYQDFLGNDIRPSQVEMPFWSEVYIKDSLGYIDSPFYFYFEEGANELTIESLREPLLIESFKIQSIKGYKAYETLKSEYQQNGYSFVNRDLQFIQAEDASFTTSPTLYPLNDRTSAKTMPSDPSLIKLNTIGGTNWGTAGDKITWEFEVEESGLYNISMRVKQRLATGMVVFRNIYIDDEIPFAEMENYVFSYSNDWRTQTLGTDKEAFQFYLEAGRHTITMEVSLGVYGTIISDLQDVINNLNKIYREILIFTGPSPDPYRDYELSSRIPNLMARFQEERDVLVAIREALISIAGARSEKTGILDTVIVQLEDFLEKPRNIQNNLSEYVSNISSLGTLVIMLSSQPIEIDYMVLHQEGAKLPDTQAMFFERTWYDFRAFLATFTTDYSAVGRRDTGEVNETIEVWLSLGQDQANILRKLIDETFAPQTSIQVDLKLVAGSALLPATLAGSGPDVAIGQSNSIPVNYALRNAVYDLTKFSDFEDVKTRFMDSAMTPYTIDDSIYALPEQQIFLMMFYRTDIFEELGLTPPQTWKEVTEMIPSLQKHNLEFYL